MGKVEKDFQPSAHSIIGERTRVSGDLVAHGFLRIDGDFLGTIETKGSVLIGESGRVESTIRAESVVVGGIVKGDIYSTKKVSILATGVVIGDIHAPRLVVEEGVIMNGRCCVAKKTPPDPERRESSSPLPHEASSASSWPSATERREKGVGSSQDDI